MNATDIWSLIKSVGYALAVYLHINEEVFTILIICMVIDTLTGILKSIKIRDDFKMKRMLWGIVIKFFYILIPLLVALAGKVLGKDYELAPTLVLRIMAVSELYSIFGNIYTLKTGKIVKDVDIISLVLNTMRSLTLKYVFITLGGLEKMGEQPTLETTPNPQPVPTPVPTQEEMPLEEEQSNEPKLE